VLDALRPKVRNSRTRFRFRLPLEGQAHTLWG
jgi:hypothetical protein